MENTGQSFRAIWWVARTTSIACMVLFLTNIATISVIYVMLPLKEIKPMLFSTQDKVNQVVHIEPLEKGTRGRDLLMETLARQYVELREVFDFQTESTRWQKAYWFSSEELGRSFQAQMGEQDSPYEQFKQRGITRSVIIKNSASVGPSAPNVWLVEWESVDRDPKTGSETHGFWTSTISAECIDRAVNLEDQYVNPIGFSVTHYTVSNQSSRNSL